MNEHEAVKKIEEHAKGFNPYKDGEVYFLLGYFQSALAVALRMMSQEQRNRFYDWQGVPECREVEKFSCSSDTPRKDPELYEKISGV